MVFGLESIKMLQNVVHDEEILVKGKQINQKCIINNLTMANKEEDNSVCNMLACKIESYKRGSQVTKSKHNIHVLQDKAGDFLYFSYCQQISCGE